MKPEELKAIRRELGLTQAELGGLLHVSRVTVAKWEGGVHPIEHVVRLAIEHLSCKTQRT